MRRSLLLPALLGLAVLVAVALLPASIPQGDDIHIPYTDLPSPTIAQGVVVSQVFPATGESLTSLGVLLDTYKRISRGNLILTLAAQREGGWQSLSTETLAKETIRDNTFAVVTFSPPLAVRLSEVLRLTLQSPDQPENGVAWWTAPDISRQGFALAVNGQEQKGTASFAVTYAHPAGRLFQMIGPIWGRMTLFLDPGWRLVLLLGIAILIATFPVFSARLLIGARWTAQPRMDRTPPADVPDDPRGLGDDERDREIEQR